jgi:hypothetical protein
MCRSEHEEVRTPALEIARRTFDPEALDRNLGAIDHELAADMAAVYGAEQWADAVDHYRKSLEIGTLHNAHARLRLIRALMGAGRGDEAAKEVEATRADPKAADFDKKLAGRWAAVASPHPVFSDLRPGIELVGEMPRGVTPGTGFLLHARVVNNGTIGWSGGWFRPAYRLIVDYVDADGRLLDASVRGRVAKNPLPLEGVLPGEAIDVQLLAIAPRMSGEVRPVIRFESSIGSLPDDGIVYRHDVPIKVGR